MSLEDLQILALILMFLTPGALFIYVCALNYSPSMRANYLREQFPLELTIVYLVASTVIHAILFLIALGIIYLIDTSAHTRLLEHLLSIATQHAVLDAPDIMFLLIVLITYLLSSLVFAYLGGQLLGKRLITPTPLWHDVLARMEAMARSRGKRCWVQLRLRNREKLSGSLVDFQCRAEGPDSFQLLISEDSEDNGQDSGQSKKWTWIDSRTILEMDLQALGSKAKFIFARD